MNNPNNSREKLYTRLKDDGYDLVDFDTFSKKLDEESSRKSLYDQMTSAGYDLGGYDEYTRKIVGSPSKQNNEEKTMISAPSASADEEYITGLGQGMKQEMQQIAAGVKYAGGEALDLVTKTAKDNASALAALDKMQAEGKDVAQETKRDAKSILLPLVGHSAPAIDMVARVFGKKNPIAKANAEVANDKIIRKALEETNGDVEAARALLEQRANEQTTADEWRDEAVQVMNEAKPTKGAGAWVGKMIPQMVGTAAGLGLSAITKSPLPAQILGLGQMGALTASTAGASMKEARDAGATNGEVWATGLADAAIEFATEAIPFKGYLSPLVKQMKSKTGKAIADVIVDKKSPARKELQNLLDKANAQLGGKLFTTESAAKYLDDVLKEGASEFTAEALQAITPMLYADPENYPTLWEVFSNGLEGLKGGIFMGSVLGGVANAATNKAQRDRRKEQGFVNVAEVKVSEDSDETTIAEVIDYDDQADRASILINGEIMPLENASKNVVNQEVFTFEEFDRGQVDMEHAESYDRGRNIATPQEKNDALNDLEAQEANIRQRYSLDPDADVYEFMGGDPITYAMNETDTELRSEILDLVNAKAVYDGMTDGINERIATTIEESDRLIDSHINKDDNLIHAAIIKGVDENSDRKVYIISGAFARNEDGTIDTTDLPEGASMIVMDATSGKKEFIDPRNLKAIAEGIDPAVQKQRAAETITNEIATKEEAEIAGTLAFVPNDIYTIADENGVEHTATIVADTQDGNVQVIIDNAQEPMLIPKEKVQQMADAYNIGRANAKIAEKKAQSTIAQSSSEVKPAIPMDEQGKPIYEQAPVEATWAELLSLNDGNAEEAIDTAKIMRDNAKKALDKANKAALAKGDTVEAIQQAKAERKALIDAAQAKYDYWDNVANYQASQTQEVAEPTTAEEQTPIVENASFDENINEVEQVYNEESNERSTENTDVSTSVPAEDGIADGDQASIEMVQGAGIDNTLGDRGSIETGQGSNESNVGEGVADVPSADVFRAEEVDVTTPQLSAKEEMRRKPLRARAKMWEAKVGVKVNLIERYEDITSVNAINQVDIANERKQFVGGWYENGQVYIYLPHTINKSELDKTYIHEVVAHHGMKELLTEKGYEEFCLRVWDEVMSEEDRNKFINYAEVKGNKAKAADEYIARLSEDVDFKPSIWQKIARIFRSAVQQVLGEKVNLKHEDIVDLLRDSYTNLATTSMTDAAAKSGKSPISFNVKTEEELQQKIRNFSKTREGKRTGWTAKQVESIIEESNALINALDKALRGNDFYEAFADREPTIRVDWRDGEAKPTVTWTRANIEYKYDMSGDLLCVNNEGIESVLTSPEMVEIMKALPVQTEFDKAKNKSYDISMISQDYLDLYDVLREKGFVVPCKGCFDAAVRFKMLPSVAQKFASDVNDIVDERNKNPEKFDAELRAKAGAATTIDGLPTTAKTRRDAIKLGVAGDNLTEHIDWTDLISAEGQGKILANNGGIFRAWQRTGAGRPKDKMLPEPYYGDIVSQTSTIIGKYGEKTPSFRDTYVNQGTGLRRNSHSEFRPVLAVDEIQFLRDAFIRNLTVFKYLKELDDVRLTREMGVKSNMSFFPEHVKGTKVSGLDIDGNYIASEESVGAREFPYIGEDGKTHYDGMKGWEEAQKLANKDASLSSVVFSIPHLIKALTDVPTPSNKEGIWGSLIPFHSSGATTTQLAAQGLGIARANGVGHGFDEAFYDYGKGVTNFEDVQNDRFGDGWVILEGKKAGQEVASGHKIEFANGTHYYNATLGVHLFSNGYVLDSEMSEEDRGNISTEDMKTKYRHPFVVDYNDKVREIGTPYAYKEAADYYIGMLPSLGLMPRFSFEVPADVFLQMCADANVDPLHPKLGWKGEGNAWNPIDAESYYSLFCDYGMTDPTTGEWSPHRPVGYINENGEREFRLPDNTIEIVKSGLDRYTDIRKKEEGMMGDAIKAFADKMVERGRLTKAQVEEILPNTSFRFIGEVGASNLDKAEEATTRLDNLAIAREMEAADKSAKTIKMATGWERGADGKWRYEVDDVKLKDLGWVKGRKDITLEDIIDDESLFTAYPKMRKMSVKRGDAYYGGVYSRQKNEIRLDIGGLKQDLKLNGHFSDRNLNILKSVIVHEIQHAIQNEENFAFGATSATPDPRNKEGVVKVREALEDVKKAKEALRNKEIAVSAYNEIVSRYNDLVSRYMIGQDVKLIAGEVEARNADRRKHMTVEERRNSLASETEDVARKDQIFIEEELGKANTQFRIVEPAPTFYSNAERAAESVKQEKATPEQWLKMIEKNGGLKAGEDKWLGLSDWLKSSDKKTLTKQEVLDFIKENQIQIEEVVYGDVQDLSAEDIQESDEFAALVDSLTDYEIDENGDEYPYINRDRYQELRNGSWNFSEGFSVDYWGEGLDIDSVEAAAEYLGISTEDRNINETRLKYTTDGLENKREIALVVPTIESWNAYDDVHFGDAGNGRAIAWVRFGETKVPIEKTIVKRVLLDAPYKDVNGNDVYKIKETRSHFIVNKKLRNGERKFVPYVNDKPIGTTLETAAFDTLEEASMAMQNYYQEHPYKYMENQRVLVIDEVQSKRHQEGREKGYRPSNIEQYLKDNGVEVIETGEFYEFHKNGELDKRFSKGLLHNDINRAKQMYVGGYVKSDIPSAPFEKNWAELAMKRMLRYAAENGFDKIAWTTGEQQAERYSLGAVMQGLKAYKTSPNTYYVIPYNNGAIGEFVKEYTEKELAETFGKEIAVNIITNAENATEENPYEMTGDDLRIGGSGMKAFYDQMIPSFMNKYGKKWGVKVGEVTMPSLEENNTMHSIDVTDAMRESVMQGQPMFRISDYDRQFDALQSEYDALDKDDEKALNEWREKKTSAVRDYLTHIKDRFGMRSELIVFNGADEEQIREAYNKVVASYKAKSNTNPPTYEDFKKKSLRKDMVAMYRKNGDTITFNATADDLNDKMQFAETMFHEDAHRVSYGLYTSDEFEAIWKDAKKSKDRVAKVVGRLYGDKNDVTKGKEYIAKAVGYLANKQKDSFMQFMRGEMPVDELLKKLRSNSKIAKLAVEETLNVIKDEYRVQVSRRGETRGMGGVGYGSGVQDSGVVLQGNGRTEQGGSADRDSRYRVRVLDSTLADMVGEESYNKFLDGVFRDADDSIRREMVNRAMQNGLDFRTATQEYLSNLVNENADSIFLSEVKDLYVGTLEDAGIDVGDISDNELRYALWKNNQKDNGVFSLAEDVVMRSKLGVGNYTQEADTSFRVAPSTPSTGKARQMYDEAVRSHTKKNNVKKSENLWHHLREAYQDSMLSVQKLMEAVLAETGNTLRSSDDVYKAENQLSSKNKAEIEKWERDFMKPLQIEVLDLIKKGAAYEDIVEYLLAKHGLERNLEFSRREAEEDGKVWDGFVKRDFSGLTELTGEAEHFTEAAQQIVDEFEDKYNTDNLWSKINAATKESLKKSYDSGLMSKETYDKVANMFQYYIPLRGWDNNVAADQYEYMANKGMKILPALKTAKGRTSRADDPIATLGSVGESSIIQGNRNLMKQKFLNFAQNNPTSLLTVDEQWYEQNADGTWKPSNPEIPADATADEVDAIIKAHEAKMEALGDKATKKRQGLNINLHTTKWEEEEHAVNVKRNGKEYKIYVNGNPIAAQAINGFTNPNANKKDSWEWIEQRATAVKNFMARAFTSMNPAFVLSNLARDIIWAGTSVAIKENADYARQYSKNISKAMTSFQLPSLVSKWKKGTLDMNDPIEKYFHEFITNGGETGFTQLNTVDDYKRNMERFIKEAQGGVTTKAKKGWRWIWDNVEFLNRSAEDTTRFMVYLTSRQMGRPISESIANAKDITVNFNKKGRGTMGANVLGFAYIFFNATIQSLANFGKLIANHPKKTATALTLFGASGMITPMVALAVQAMLSGDDDEPTYWDLPEWVRRNNIVIYVGGSGYVTIPLPHELRPFYGMGELAFSTLMGKEEPEVALQKAVEGFSSLMPFDFTGNAGNAIVNFTPTIAQPLVQLVVNKDYFGTPIYRKTAFNEQDPEWTKAYKSTNQLLVDATEFLNELTGGDEVKNGLIDLNPAVIEHLYEGYLGGMGKTINRAAKTFSMLWDEDARTWRNVPVASSFYQVSDERTSGSQVNREYFDAVDEADAIEHLYSGYRKRAKMGVEEYAEKLNELIESDAFKRYQKVNSYKKAIDKMNTVLKEADPTDREDIETRIMELKVDMLEELDAMDIK